ncbi:pyrroloquinoline quinone biosynthesis protein PqqE [Candidatus Acidianus copahuensis]|uniref:Pyrroloquinoline quinone biosynthesis protein PqqE n=2 Tax=Candidatus Acidianus copahuensis TaxID=1160895 RepID=A0A031LQP2_9CREN|nr:pyrroloquinoline quinone biosynthesis protein PqqE [Candidatus Acidianus copahuensis]
MQFITLFQNLPMFSDAPHLVFWEMTKACPLTCLHCRANSLTSRLPDELTTEEAKNFLRELPPRTVVIFTGGDPLIRDDLIELISFSRSLGLIPSVAPAPSKSLIEKIDLLKKAGASSISISIDGATSETHDKLRGYGNFNYAIQSAKRGVEVGLGVQINTVIWRESFTELPRMVKLLKELGVKVWEVFFLIPVGRGKYSLDIDYSNYMDVIQFLVDVTTYGIAVRTVEAPFFRRALLERSEGKTYESPTYIKMINELRSLQGNPINPPQKSTLPTRDGSGIIFISYNGDVYPSGFLPLRLGNIREKSLLSIYRENPILKKIREEKMGGRCGKCEFSIICGGSRARAYTLSKDPFAEDPLCPYFTT